MTPLVLVWVSCNVCRRTKATLGYYSPGPTLTSAGSIRAFTPPSWYGGYSHRHDMPFPLRFRCSPACLAAPYAHAHKWKLSKAQDNPSWQVFWDELSKFDLPAPFEPVEVAVEDGE